MAGKAELVVRLDCSWRRVEPDGQTCLVCGDVIWLGPLELFMAVEGEQGQDFGVVQLASPALDQGAVVDAVPGEAADLRGEALGEELVESVDVVLGEGADEETPAVSQHCLLGVTVSHG